jgi:predicted enzyme related to lactoylglutathione lyase
MFNHPIVHVEFSAYDQQKAAKFYSDLFGWETQSFPVFNYVTFRASEEVGGGINPVSEEYPAGQVMFYVGTDDIQATLSKAESLGGKCIMPEMEVPGMGWMAVFEDQSGIKVGLWKSVPMQGGQS